MNPRFTIGTVFTRKRTNSAQEYTIVDILRTYNSKDELVKIRYVGECKFLGQTITDSDITDTEIARSLFDTNMNS